MGPAVPPRRDVYPGDIVIKRIKGAPAWGDPCFRLGTVMNQAGSSTAYVNHNSKSFHVMWEQNSRVELSNLHQVGIVNRQIARGTKVSSDDGLEGKVVGSKTLATVHIMGTTNVVDKVGIERLSPVTNFVRGQQIMYKSWVGYIASLKKNVHFILDGGMGFYIPSQEKDGFVRTDLYWGPGVTCPGMRSRISGRQMKGAVWTAKPLRFITRFFPSLSYLYSMTPCTIIKTEITELEIDWLQVAPGIQDPGSVPQPSNVIDRSELENVVIAGEPSSEVLGYNSVRILKVKAEDSLTSVDKWTDFFLRKFADAEEAAEIEKLPAENFDKLRAMVRTSRLDQVDGESSERLGSFGKAAERPYEVAVKVLNLHTLVDVQWSDGETTTIPATKVASISPYEYQGDYPMGMIVAPLYKTPADGDRYGIVQESGMSLSGDGKGRTGKLVVKWVSNDEEVSEPEEISAFDVSPHAKYSMYQRGAVVFPRSFGGMPFKSGYVVDMDISAAKVVVVSPVDMKTYEVFPHKVEPFNTRVYWNFFQRKYHKDTILPPPFQLEVEFSPTRFFPEETGEPPANILAPENNNPEGVPSKQVCIWDEPSFDLMAFAPESHRYFKTKDSSRGFGKEFSGIMEKEFEALKKPGAVPEGVWVRSYENRMDLVSVLMVGPSQTPYEEGIYQFDLQLSPTFPEDPPRTHFVSYSMEINPLTSWDGNFCVSSLDWNFKLMEEKPPTYIGNFVAQVQGKLFTKEPFFCDKNKAFDPESPAAQARARMYNEQTFLRVLDSTWNMIHFPHAPWGDFVKAHFASTLPAKLAEIQSWDLTKAAEGDELEDKQPSYPLAPVCVGFLEALNKRLDKFKKIVPVSTKQAARLWQLDLITDETADSESTPVQEESEAVEVKLDFVEPVNANEMMSVLEPLEVEVMVMSAEETARMSRPGSPVHVFLDEATEGVKVSRPGSPAVIQQRSRPGSPVAKEMIQQRSRPGSPDAKGSRPGSREAKKMTQRSRPGSPDAKDVIPRSRPGSPSNVIQSEKEVRLIPDVFKIPSRKDSSELVGNEGGPEESGSVGSVGSEKISPWPEKPQTPEDPTTPPDDQARVSGFLAHLKVPLDSLKNVIRKHSKSKSKSKSKKRKDKKSRKTGPTPPAGSSIGSGGESDMDETDLDLTKRLTADVRPSSPEEDRPSSAEERPSTAEERPSSPEDRPVTPTSQHEDSAPEEIEAD